MVAVTVNKSIQTSPFNNFMKKAAFAVGCASLAAITHVALSAIGFNVKAALVSAGTALAGAFTATNVVTGTLLIFLGISIASIVYLEAIQD